MALCVRAIRSAERLLSGRSGSDPSYERFKIPADVCAASVPQALPCLVSPPESKYVRILASVLFQIGQYARIGQVDSLRVLPIPARYLNEPFQNALSSMGDSNSCPSVANRAVWAREILTQIKGQLKGHSGGGWSATTSDGRRLPAMQETPIL
jgi:hypothetical protein